MFWEVFWPLALGFALSAIIQAVVSQRKVAGLLGGTGLKNICLATLFGAASSSCSYAAVALAKSIFKKGASFLSSMVFELASTNLVLELGIILIVLLGWKFAAATWLGGLIMIALLTILFKLTLSSEVIEAARKQTEKGLVGRMEGHAQMDMSITEGSFFSRLFSSKDFTAVSHYFVMDWASVWQDLLLGFLIAGALAAWVPDSFWKSFFFANNPTMSFIIGPLAGPLIAIISFVCSVGNIPLAAVLWRGGISFGGVVSFIFADLIVLPILDIYRKYYGWKVMLYILITFFITMAGAGYLVELLFKAFNLIPTSHAVGAIERGVQWNYTSVLNIIFFIISSILLARFLTTKGLQMLRMMDKPISY